MQSEQKEEQESVLATVKAERSAIFRSIKVQ